MELEGSKSSCLLACVMVPDEMLEYKCWSKGYWRTSPSEREKKRDEKGGERKVSTTEVSQG